MKRKEIKVEDILRLPPGSLNDMERALDRVLDRLRSHTGRNHGHAHESHPAHQATSADSGPHPTLRGPFKRWSAMVAAAALLTTTVWIGWIGFEWQTRYGTLETVAGASHWILPETPFGETGGVLTLRDRSRVEIRAMSEVSLDRAADGVRIRLNNGAVIVNAARQRNGRLYVETKDMTMSVVGTVFVVRAEKAGSRVAVVQGEVDVRQGSLEKKLGPGQQIATNLLMESVPIIKELAWSRNAEAHLALLQQEQFAGIPKWKAVSVRPCEPDPAIRRGWAMEVFPGRLNVNCMNAMFSIRNAYVAAATDVYKDSGSVPILGGPAWIESDMYSMEAKAEGSPEGQTVEGPMLRALLEDRFKLRVHRETRDIPVYELTVDKDGLKMEPLREGSCDPDCGVAQFGEVTDFFGMNFDDIAAHLGRLLDRPVINKTGLAGLFHFRVRFAPGTRLLDGVTPGADSPIFKAILEQAGLRLEPAKGPGEFLVIDNIERPAAN